MKVNLPGGGLAAGEDLLNWEIRVLLLEANNANYVKRGNSRVPYDLFRCLLIAKVAKGFIIHEPRFSS